MSEPNQNPVNPSEPNPSHLQPVSSSQSPTPIPTQPSPPPPPQAPNSPTPLQPNFPSPNQTPTSTTQNFAQQQQTPIITPNQPSSTSSTAQTPLPPQPPTPVPSQPKPTSPLQPDDELSEDQFITGGADHSSIASTPIPPHPKTTFAEAKFSQLLAQSISLTKKEKQNIIKSIPQLSQYQIDELTKIFIKEKAQFQKLKNNTQGLKDIEAKHKKDWNDIEIQAKAEVKQKEDAKSAADIRKKLGL